MNLMSDVLGMHGHASKAEGHRAHGGSKALPHREAGLEPQNTWRYRSPARRWSWCLGHVATSKPSCAGDGSRAVRYVATPEPSPAG
jgi:hypothetical protein